MEHGQAVRAGGRPVPQIHRIEDSNLFRAFTTDYQPTQGKHWSPDRTEGDDILPFPTGNQRVGMLIEYSNNKRFSAISTVAFREAPTETSNEPESVPTPQLIHPPRTGGVGHSLRSDSQCRLRLAHQLGIQG